MSNSHHHHDHEGCELYQQYTVQLEGLDCANCARELEEELAQLDGVQTVMVNFMAQKVFAVATPAALAALKDKCNHFEDVKVVELPHEESDLPEAYKIAIEGLDCANCARELEEEIAHISGVTQARVDFIAQKVYCTCDEKTLQKVIETCNHFEEVKVLSWQEPQRSTAPQQDGKKIKIKDLCCANCARELEEDLNKLEGVSATVDFMNMQVLLKATDTEAYQKAVYTITHFEDVKIVSDEERPQSPVKEHLKDILCLAISAVLFVPALVFTKLALGGVWQIISYILFGISYLVVGHPVLINTAKNLAKGKVFDENFLMTIASIGAVILGIVNQGEGFEEGVAVMLLYQLGELLQGIAVGSSRQSITRLMDLKSETATLVQGESQLVVAPEQLQEGDVILVKVGEKIPVDGVILEGQSALDLKSLNGESVPKEVEVGDEVLSGSINLSKVLKIKVLRRYSDSAVAKILDLVENSTAVKAKPEKFISKFAKVYTPAVCIAAIVVASLVPTVICAIQASFAWATYADWIYKALCFLVISCPCALVISVPLSYFGGIGQCAKFGILVKGSTSLDALAATTVAAFDKTGTLTQGTFGIVSSSSKVALSYAAAAEKLSSHPIAVAFQNVATSVEVSDVEEVAGQGVSCLSGGKRLLVGNAKLLQNNGVEFPVQTSSSVVVYVALDGQYIGFVCLDDQIKPDAKQALSALRSQGVKTQVMLTGDSESRAQSVSKILGLDSYRAALMPDQKLEQALALKQQGALLYVGDGINDAPVMTCADVAVSMGKVGSAAAIEASDVVLVSDNLSLIAQAKKIAKATKTIVYENIVVSLAIKLAIMLLDLTWGLIVPGAAFPLIISVLGDVGVMLLAVLNSLRTHLVR